MSTKNVQFSNGSVLDCDLNSEQFFLYVDEFYSLTWPFETKLLVQESGIQKVWIFNGGPYECQVTICYYSDKFGFECLVLKSCLYLANRQYIWKLIQLLRLVNAVGAWIPTIRKLNLLENRIFSCSALGCLVYEWSVP